MKTNIIKPPNREPKEYIETSIFLAGSIEMGTASEWQDEFAKKIDPFGTRGYTFFNPRRNDWDSSWEQNINNPQFYEQVSWELDHIEMSDYVIFNFIENTKSPITLMELGYAIGLNKENIAVCCPDGFWRKGNVDIICQRAGVPVFNNMDCIIKLIKSRHE